MGLLSLFCTKLRSYILTIQGKSVLLRLYKVKRPIKYVKRTKGHQQAGPPLDIGDLFFLGAARYYKKLAASPTTYTFQV